MHLGNGNESKRKKVKTFSYKMICKIKQRSSVNFFIEHRILTTENFLLVAKLKFRNLVVKFFLVWLNQLTRMHLPLAILVNVLSIFSVKCSKVFDQASIVSFPSIILVISTTICQYTDPASKHAIFSTSQAVVTLNSYLPIHARDVSVSANL